MANWSELPLDICSLIMKKLPPYIEEYVTFSSVCKSWRFCCDGQQLTLCSPWLMLPEKKTPKKRKNNHNHKKRNTCTIEDGVRSFYNIAKKRVFHYNLPEASGKRCWGTSFGWLVTLGIDRSIHLLHPFSRKEICLPSQATFNCMRGEDFSDPQHMLKCFIDRFVLVSNPSPWSDAHIGVPLVMTMFGGVRRLAFASFGDNAWKILKSPPGAHDDVIFFKDTFYAISTQGNLRICHLNVASPEAIDIASPPDDTCASDKFYLVEMFGALHLVARTMDVIEAKTVSDYHYGSSVFLVYKFDFERMQWIDCENFDGRALFVGNSASFAISTSIYPEYRSNCIYFTDDHCEGYGNKFCDMGVYDYAEAITNLVEQDKGPFGNTKIYWRIGNLGESKLGLCDTH